MSVTTGLIGLNAKSKKQSEQETNTAKPRVPLTPKV